MFHPVGPQPPSVYWRRRLVLLGSVGMLLVLLVLTMKIASSDGSTTPTGAGRTTPAETTPIGHRSAGHSSSSSAPPTRPSSSSSTSSSKSSSAGPQPCASKDLEIAAVASQPSYHVGDEPVLELQVTNTSDQACVQDLADSQVELKVYNGESRVWGSHDCQIQPGTNERTLEPDTPVRVAITWSGLTSQPQCAGTRQRVGAGTYTLYALLSGRTGKAAQFTIT